MKKMSYGTIWNMFDQILKTFTIQKSLSKFFPIPLNPSKGVQVLHPPVLHPVLPLSAITC